ncbi:MAG: DUF1214 domain-containing protein [Alphaproteobacteria bacterium]|nr:DUF1214 domain-containing protein [Alphaproteobacteria bacterium]
MKRLLNGPAFLVAGLIMGVASAVVAVDSFGNSLVEAGSPWQGRAIPASGRASPYVTAHYLLDGRLPQPAGQMIEFSAISDNAGNRITSSCIFRLVMTKEAQPRWWSVTALGNVADRKLAQTVVTSDTVVAEADGEIRIVVSRDPQAGNWLMAPRSGAYSLLYTASHETSLALTGAAGRPALLSINREGC